MLIKKSSGKIVFLNIRQSLNCIGYSGSVLKSSLLHENRNGTFSNNNRNILITFTILIVYGYSTVHLLFTIST